MRVSWLADVLRSTGSVVHELDGWKGKGAPLDRVEGVIWHHTVTPATTPDEAVARLLRDGHATLNGPLSQLGLDRKGRWWVIADGRCNHNGHGLYGNQSIGIEAFHDGSPDTPWPPAQIGSWVSGTAAILAHLGMPCERVLGHKESDPGRKSDPAGLPMERMREFIAANEPPEEDDMSPEQAQMLAEIHQATRTEWGVSLAWPQWARMEATMAAAVAGQPLPDFDEEQLAADIAALIDTAGLAKLADADFNRIAQVVNDEHARRQAG